MGIEWGIPYIYIYIVIIIYYYYYHYCYFLLSLLLLRNDMKCRSDNAVETGCWFCLCQFWLKAPVSSFGMNFSAGGGELEESHFSEDFTLVVLLSLSVGLGAAIGGATVYWFIAPRASGVQQLPRPPWARLVVRALRFIRRRRSVSLAFNNLGTYSLRPAENSRANQLRQRRASTPGPRGSGPVRPSSSASVLHEGPALQHGSDRSRDGGHRGH